MNVKKFFTAAGTLLLVPALVILNIDCSKKYSLPASPSSGPTPTPTSSIGTNPNGPLIEVYFLNVSITGVSTNSYVSAFIEDNLGNPVTTAAVTLTTVSGSIPVTCVGVGSPNPPANMGISNITGGQYYNSTAYTPGQLCTVSVLTGGITYTSSFTASNASGNLSTGSGGVTATYTVGGNENLVEVEGKDTFQVGPVPPITSPYLIPTSSFPNDPAGAGNDLVVLLLMQLIEPAFSGANASSVIGSGIETGFYY